MSSWNDFRREVVGTIHIYERCEHPDPVLCKQRTVRGVTQYFNWCFRCSHYVTTERWGVVFISARRLQTEGIDPESVPLLRDHATPENQERNKRECARCHALAFCDSHHWAPKHLFGEDADSWPQSYLCRPCHDEWHRTVTPNMHRRGR